MITNQRRLGTTELLFKCAEQMELAPVWMIPLDTFMITVDGQERYINQARSHLNSESSAGLARNKYVTRRILERHGMQNIPFALPRSLAEAEIFLAEHKKIIAKPVTGFGAQDIHIVTETSQFKTLAITGYILEKYIAGKELRYLFLNDQVIGAHRSEYGTSVAENRPLQRISYPKSLWKSVLIDSSLRIAEILNLKFGAVDYMIDTAGQAHILEVNTTPGFKWFHAPSSGPIVDVARLFLESIVNEIRAESALEPNELASTPLVAYT